MSVETYDKLVPKVLKSKVGKYFSFTDQDFVNTDCEHIYRIYTILDMAFSEHEMGLLLDKALNTKNDRFFKYIVIEYDIKENFFTGDSSHLLVKISYDNIDLLEWVVDYVGFTLMNKSLKSDLFSGMLSKLKNMRTFKKIIRKLNILPDDIDPFKYMRDISILNVQVAIEVIELFPIDLKPGFIDNMLLATVMRENYGFAKWIILNYTITYNTAEYDIDRIACIIYSLNIKNTEETKMLIEMLLKNLGKSRDDIIRDSDMYNPFQTDE